MTPQSAPLPESGAVMARYKDGYSVARGAVRIGNFYKSLSIIIGIGIAVVGLLVAQQTNNAPLLIPALVLAFAVSAGLWMMGVLIAAQGQLLQAAFDTAVNTSPFLTNEQRSVTMSLAG